MFTPRPSLLTARLTGRRGRGKREPERQLAGVLGSAPPTGEHIHRPGSAERNGSYHALRINEGQGDGVKKLARCTTTARTRVDRTKLDFHQGRGLDGDSRRGHAVLRRWDTIYIDRNGPIVIIVVHDGHNRRGRWALRNRRRRRNVQGENRRRALRRGAPGKPDGSGLRRVET